MYFRWQIIRYQWRLYHQKIMKVGEIMTTIEALKNLAVAIGCASTTDEVTGSTIAEVIDFMAKNYPSEG